MIPRGGCTGRASAPRWRGGRTPRAACGWGAPGAPGGRAPWAQTKPGADAPRRLGPPRWWSLGREEKDLGRRPGQRERLGRPPCGRPGGLLGGRRTGWGAALSNGPTRGSPAATGLAESQARKGAVCWRAHFGGGAERTLCPGLGAGALVFGGAGEGAHGPLSELAPGQGHRGEVSPVADTYGKVCAQVVCRTCRWWHTSPREGHLSKQRDKAGAPGINWSGHERKDG